MRVGWGPLEWIAVKSGLISCAEAGQGCLRGKLFKKVLEIARSLGYIIQDTRKPIDKVHIIENRITINELPEKLPAELMSHLGL